MIEDILKTQQALEILGIPNKLDNLDKQIWTVSGIRVETDPIVGAINGLVKADGIGNILAAVADTDYLTPGTANFTYLKLDASNDPLTGDLTLNNSATALTLPAFTAGSVLFAGTGGVISQDNANLVWNDTNKWLGIGITPTTKVEVEESREISTSATSVYSSKFTFKPNVLVDQTDKSMGAMQFVTRSEGSHNYYWTRGITGVASHSGTGIVNSALGVASNVQLEEVGGSITNAYAYHAGPPQRYSGDKTISNAYGLFIVTQKQSFVTTGYGVYQTGTGDINYFAGNIGIRTTAPGAKLQINTLATATKGQILKAFSTIGTAAFTGTGLDDMTSGGTFTGIAITNYRVRIDGVNTGGGGTDYTDPNGDVATSGWTPTPAGTHYTTIDEATRQPTVPDTADYISAADGGGQDDFNMTTFTAATVTQIKVWVYGENPGAQAQFQGNIYVAGAWQTAGTFSVGTPAGSPSWGSITYDGSWTQADLDNLKVRLIRSGINMTATKCFAMYAEVTYSGAGGYDTFEWSDDGGSTWDATDVQITGSAQALNNGVTVTFGATSGHTLNDYWDFTATPQTANLLEMQNPAGTVLGAVNGIGNFTLLTNKLLFGAAGSEDTNLYRSAANILATDDDFSILTVGKGLNVAEGTNARMGASVLVNGTVTVSTTAVTANSRIFLTSQVDGGTVGFLRVSGRTAGTSFTITSSSATDTSTVAWIIFEPAS